MHHENITRWVLIPLSTFVVSIGGVVKWPGTDPIREHQRSYRERKATVP